MKRRKTKKGKTATKTSSGRIVLPKKKGGSKPYKYGGKKK